VPDIEIRNAGSVQIIPLISPPIVDP
jgi:hypothetical protein